MLFFAMAYLVGCDIYEPMGAKFEVISVTKGMEDYGRPYIVITVKNVGNAMGYSVSCDIKIIKGESVVDHEFAFFRGGRNIEPGESASDKVIFYDLKSHDDYDKLEYDMDWSTGCDDEIVKEGVL